VGVVDCKSYGLRVILTVVSCSTMSYGNELEEVSTLEDLLTEKTTDCLPFVKPFTETHRTSWLAG
jgi:hypothetical protein